MIYDKISNISKYKGLNANLDATIKYIEKNDIFNITEPEVIISSGAKLLNMEVTPYKEKDAWFERHGIMADLHVILEDEKLHFEYHDDLDEKIIKEWDSKQDVELFTAKNHRVTFNAKKGEFLLFWPGEAHAPKISDTKSKMKKIVIKIKIN
ncbi:YhcH/YjgK/YiaL family protein [Mycoplasma testudineum]|uniref:YhcH/YjgK/YiaL family protein n=1 Tax=Mycoplasma testudineum TaxID=244584 RepID=A0A4V3C316_9MOLU|nr:YhcH/YjgK/YiaL family protein [Mycoplasma testudineum]OYD26835.1 hypothetical protein CG473_01855 [Mycoplasma testudineum]TDO20369.1 YhcH/YjgK/YiaL family protein [Mycoplasma testudineum]